jgi:hypothetical protein
MQPNTELYSQLQGDLGKLARFPLGYEQFKCALAFLYEKWAENSTKGTQQTDEVLSALQGEYFAFKNVFWFQGAFPPGVSNSNQGLEGGFCVVKMYIHFWKRRPLAVCLDTCFNGVRV